MAEKEGLSEAAKREEKVLAFWKERGIFEKSLKKPSPKGEFVFYDGPPFATGLPHSGSLLSSVSKDVIPRYKTMRGYFVRRRWGWDTHGLPIESLVEKELGLKNKKEILQVGIEKFNETARSMVLTYVHDWKKYVERVGRWVDFDNSYKTMDPSYTESVWWALSQIHKKGRLYEGRKVLMYCPHCETPLAKAEIAMDNTYKDVTDEAVTVKFKVKNPSKYKLPENTYILAWTTTPWTLPGNVALAVGLDIEYVAFLRDGATYIVAKERSLLIHGAVTKSFTGKELVGIEYEPLFDIPKIVSAKEKKYVVVPADFVTTEDGSGVVHTAVMYGEDDFALGQKEKLPMVQLLNPNGTYNDEVPEFLRGQYIRKANPFVIQDLENREGGSLIYSLEQYHHSYPHCYRCGTALIYNAVSSWFINIQAVKDRMLEENERISWTPEHLKHGRFRHILDTAPDWTISRNRFWASPLPIWKDAEGNVTVVGSLDELKSLTKKSGNTYFAMRHGEAVSNTQNRLDGKDSDQCVLTEKGREDARASARKLKSLGVTTIYSSPFTRTLETAKAVARELSIPESSIIVDERLREFRFGELDGKSPEELFAFRSKHAFDEKIPGGESDQDVKNRFGAFLYELEATRKDETILIVTHGAGLEAFSTVVAGLDKEASRNFVCNRKFVNGEVLDLGFVPIPHNRDYELDFHLPYIDEVKLEDAKGRALTRIPEVVDCWVESGSMPFAEYHYPFENRAEFEKRSPGDFISEYIGQTRAWFYYMHAMSVELFDRQSFRNVITTGNVNAADGAKLSKSKKNYTDPYELFDKYGADAFRYYLMGSVLMQAEDLTFRDDEVKEAHSRVVNMLRNVLAFYALFAEEVPSGTVASSNPLDRWIRARMKETITQMTEAYERYDVPRATRPIRDLVDDLSTWYVRRSRDRVKGDDLEDKARALTTLREVLLDLSKVIAPVMPFIAEEIFQEVKGADAPESVHLTEWPTVKVPFFARLTGAANNEALFAEMRDVRRLASEALMLRQKAALPVRQPLRRLSIVESLSPELAALLADEVNVKQIQQGAKELALDTELDAELIKEGDERQMQRAIAEARKSLGLMPKDTVEVVKGEGPFQAELSTGAVQFNLRR